MYNVQRFNGVKSMAVISLLHNDVWGKMQVLVSNANREAIRGNIARMHTLAIQVLQSDKMRSLRGPLLIRIVPYVARLRRCSI